MSKLPSEVISLDLHIKGDLEQFNYPYFDYVISLYDAYQNNGVMPFNGAHADQPAKIIEIFNILNSLMSERETRIREEQAREAQRQNRKTNGRR